LNATGGNGANDYAWAIQSGGGAFTASNIANPSLTAGSTANTYSVSLTVTGANSCTASTTASIEVKALPTASITTSLLEVCAGANLSLNATGGNGANDYAWAIQSGGGTFTASNIANPSLTAGTTANIYSVSLTVTGANSCTASTSASLTVKAQPTASITTSPLSVCAGANLSLNATGGNGTNDYAWDIQSGGGTFTASNIANPSLTAGTTANTYSVSLTVTGANSCTASTTASISVLATSTVSISSANFICENQPITLTTTPLSGANYSWSFTTSNTAQTPGIFDNSSTAPSIVYSSGTNNVVSFTPNDNGSITVSVSVLLSNGCSVSAQKSFSSRSKPSYTFSYDPVATPTRQYCPGATVTIAASNTLSTHQYSWGIDNGSKGSFSTSSASPTILTVGDNATTALITATLSVSLTNTATTNGCSNVSTATIAIKRRPVIALPSASTICSGTTGGAINLTVSNLAGGGPASYSWSNSATSEDLTGLAPGPYNVTVTNTNTNNGCTATANYTISAFSLPTVVISAGQSTVCAGQQVSLTLTGDPVTTVLWTGSGTFSSTSGNPSTNFSASTPGTYTVTASVTNSNNCVSSAITTVTVVTKPTFSLSAIGSNGSTGSTNNNSGASSTTVSICAGGSMVISTNPSTGLRFTLNVTNNNNGVTFNGNAINTGTSDVSASVLNTTYSPYNFTGAGTSGSFIQVITPYLDLDNSSTLSAGDCVGDPITLQYIIVKPTATISASSQGVCVGATANVNFTGNGGTSPYTFEYSINSGMAQTTSNNSVSVSTSSAATLSYQLSKVTDQNGCANPITGQTTSVTVNALPGGSISLPSGVQCVDNTVSLGFVSSSASPALPYTIVVSGVSYTVTSSSQSLSYSITSTGTTTLQLTSITDANGCVLTGSPISSATVVANQKPTVTVAEAPSATVCVGISINHSASVSPSSPASGSYTYEWYAVENNATSTSAGFSPGNLSGGSATQTRTWSTPGNNNNYYLLRVITPGCTDTDDFSQNFSVVADPSVSITPNPAVVCSGNSLTLTATPSGGTGSYTYSWDAGTAVMGNPNQRNTGSLTTAATFNVTISNSLGCNATSSRTVTVNARPVIVSPAAVTVATCTNSSNGAIDLNASGASTLTYSWSRNGGGFTDPGTQDLTGIPAGTYNVTVTDGNGCSSSLSGIVVGTNPGYNLSVTTSNVLCNGGTGGSINLTVNGGNTPFNYSWTRNGVGFTTINGINTAGGIGSLTAGTYNVTVTDASNCTLTGSYQITQPSSLTATLSVAQVACGNTASGSINLSVSGGAGTKNYSFNGPTSISSGSMPNGSRAFTGLLGGTFNVTVSDGNGCQTTAQVMLPRFGVPSNALALGFQGDRCYGQNVQLNTNYNGYPSVRYSWASTGFTSTAASPTVILGTTTARTYSVTVTLPSCSITATATASVTTKGLPNVGTIGVVGGTLNATANTYSICSGNPLTFTLTGHAGESFNWRGPTGAGSGVFTNVPAAPTATVASPRQGQYTITAGIVGCSQINHKVINVQLLNCATRIASGVDADGEAITMVVNPNPVEHTAIVQVTLQKAGAVRLKLMQAGDGRTLQSLESTEEATQHRFELDMTHQTAGTYLILAEAEYGQAVKKIVKVTSRE
jgi:PKD repeat protein